MKPFRTGAARAQWTALIFAMILLLSSTLLGGCTVDFRLEHALPQSWKGQAAPTAIPTAAAGIPPPPTPAPQAAPLVLTGANLTDLSAAEQLLAVAVPPRDLAAIRRRLDPALNGIPTMPAPMTYTVGDRLAFHVLDSDSADYRTINAELTHATDVAYAWVEEGQAYDAALIRDAIDTFSTRIYPAAVTAFGREMSPGVDGDPRLHVLHATGMGSVAGYFLGSDQNSRVGLPSSNEKEMFYISLEWLASLPSQEMYETVLAHEFQHMIHYAHDRNEEVWINEGLSEYAQEVAGYPADYVFAGSYLYNTDVQLNSWQGTGGSNAPHYGAAYLFVRYLVQQYGPPIARDLVTEEANGVAGVRRVLSRQPGSPTFEQTFADWVVALALDQPDALDGGGRFGFDEIDPGMARPIDASVALAAAPQQLAAEAVSLGSDLSPVQENVPLWYHTTVQNFALDLYDLGRADNLDGFSLHFAGDTQTRLAAVEPFSGRRAWWANRSDDSEARLTRVFDLSTIPPGQPVSADVTMAWDIERDYDFGYVQASADGIVWQILPGRQTTTNSTSSTNIGPGYTGLGLPADTAAEGADPHRLAWVTESFDLSAYAGGPLHLRFAYLTDDAVTRPGWFIDDVSIPVIGYYDDMEWGAPGWQSEGWLLTDGLLPQRWLLQLLELDKDDLVAVTPLPVDESGAAQIRLDGASGSRYLLAISGMTEGTTEPALYRLTLEPAGP